MTALLAIILTTSAGCSNAQKETPTEADNDLTTHCHFGIPAVEALQVKALDAEKAGDRPKAEQLMTDAIAVEKKYGTHSAYWQRAQLTRTFGKTDLAIEDLWIYGSDNPACMVAAKQAVALCHLDQKKYDQCWLDLASLPKGDDIYNGLIGRLLCQRKQYQEAHFYLKKYCDRLVPDMPRSPDDIDCLQALAETEKYKGTSR